MLDKSSVNPYSEHPKRKTKRTNPHPSRRSNSRRTSLADLARRKRRSHHTGSRSPRNHDSAASRGRRCRCNGGRDRAGARRVKAALHAEIAAGQHLAHVVVVGAVVIVGVGVVLGDAGFAVGEQSGGVGRAADALEFGGIAV